MYICQSCDLHTFPKAPARLTLHGQDCAFALIAQVGPVTASARTAKPQAAGSYRNRSLVSGSGAQGLIRSKAGIPNSRCAFSKRCRVARARSSKILKTSQI